MEKPAEIAALQWTVKKSTTYNTFLGKCSFFVLRINGYKITFQTKLCCVGGKVTNIRYQARAQ